MPAPPLGGTGAPFAGVRSPTRGEWLGRKARAVSNNARAIAERGGETTGRGPRYFGAMEAGGEEPAGVSLGRVKRFSVTVRRRTPAHGVLGRPDMERETGLEPATSSLGKRL